MVDSSKWAIAVVKALYCCMEWWCEVLVYERKYGVCLVFGEAKMAYGLGGVIYILIAGRRKQCPVI